MPDLRRGLLAAMLGAAAAWGAAAIALEPPPGLPAGPADLQPGWQAVGRGEMSWFGFKLYDAELWSQTERFGRDTPHALSLRYARDIPSERLVAASIDEMRRLGERDEARLDAWRQALAQVFPDVRRGDTIVGLHLPARGAVFYHQGRKTGEIRDPAFARAFFAIWLDPRTREPGLRERLLGGDS